MNWSHLLPAQEGRQLGLAKVNNNNINNNNNNRTDKKGAGWKSGWKKSRVKGAGRGIPTLPAQPPLPADWLQPGWR